MNRITLFGILLVTLSSFIIPESKITNDSAIIEVEVILKHELDTINLPPYCGTLMTQQTFIYEVVELKKGEYFADTIAIHHTCIRELVENKFLENEKVYSYKLRKRFGIREFKVGQRSETVFMNDYEILE